MYPTASTYNLEIYHFSKNLNREYHPSFYYATATIILNCSASGDSKHEPDHQIFQHHRAKSGQQLDIPHPLFMAHPNHQLLSLSIGNLFNGYICRRNPKDRSPTPAPPCPAANRAPLFSLPAYSPTQAPGIPTGSAPHGTRGGDGKQWPAPRRRVAEAYLFCRSAARRRRRVTGRQV